MEEEFLIGQLSSSSSDSTSEEEVLDAEIFNEFYLDNIEHLVWKVEHYVSDAALSVLLFLLRYLFYLFFSFSSDLAKSFFIKIPQLQCANYTNIFHSKKMILKNVKIVVILLKAYKL